MGWADGTLEEQSVYNGGTRVYMFRSLAFPEHVLLCDRSDSLSERERAVVAATAPLVIDVRSQSLNRRR